MSHSPGTESLHACLSQDEPLCSVLVANFNGEHLLTHCLDSIRAQITSSPIEVIVHDDASVDRSLEILATYPEAQVLRSEVNVGFCVANNRMAAAARGRYLLLLNNDAELLDDALATLLSLAGEQPGDAVLSLPQYDRESGSLVDRGARIDPFCNPVPITDKRSSDAAMVIGACLWIPKRAWDALGGFPEWMESLGEDLYLCSAARLRGWPVRVAASSGYRHRQGASFGGNRPTGGRLASTYRRRFLSESNKTAVLATCTPGLVVWVLLTLHLPLLVLEGIVLAVLLRDTDVWRRVYWASLKRTLRQRHALCRVRRELQATRNTTIRSYFRQVTWMPGKLRLLLRYGVPSLR